ncbi:MAG: hypothetical protein AAF518_28435 [Spirochaetota bacterium]
MRTIPKRNALLYVSYQCPISDCGKKHILSEVKELVGTISEIYDFEGKIKNGTMFLSLWNHESEQARFAEIDALKIHYVANFQEEDYNQAIQTVVNKVCNSMAQEKIKKLKVEIVKDVSLSEASKRLLQNTFGEIKES